VPLIDIISAVCLGVVFTVLLMDGLLWLFFKTGKQKRYDPLFRGEALPSVSILVAARNEEANLERCLRSLVEQQYAAEKLEILVGNDWSEDGTQNIIDEFVGKHPMLRSVEIKKNLGLARGKSNVLANLALKAKGEVLLITDADMWLPPNWAKTMVTAFEKSTGIVTGFTLVRSNSWFSTMQSVDWAFALGMIKVITDRGMPVTSMGNNMAVLTKAYQSTGGYEKLPFSITEDFQLTKAVLSKGYTIKQEISPELTGLTLPSIGFTGLLQQRKRWATGVMQLPFPIIVLLGLQAFYYPAAILVAVVMPWLSGIIAGKFFVQAVFARSVFSKAGMPSKIGFLLSFEFYSAIISLSTLIFYFVPARIKWKGRYY